MAGNNSKVLSNLERSYFNDHYDVRIVDNEIVVTGKKYRRITKHKIAPFSILVKEYRRFTITQQAIDIWLQIMNDEIMKDFSIFDIQDAITRLLITYQEVTVLSVKSMMIHGLNKL